MTTASVKHGATNHGAGDWRRLVLVSLVVLLLGVAGVIGGAMWDEARRARPIGITVPATRAVAMVVLLREGGSGGGVWRVESIGPFGHNESYDFEDPQRTAFVFLLEGWERGQALVWERGWRIGPKVVPPPKPDPRRAIARAALSEAILDGSVAWPVELASSDSAAHWDPVNHALSGIAQRPAWLLILLAPVAFIAVLTQRHRRWRREGACRGCGYALAGLPSGAVCPECGRV